MSSIPWDGYATSIIEIALDDRLVVRLGHEGGRETSVWPFGAEVHVVTAANPESRRLAEAENRSRNRELRHWLDAECLAWTRAVGYSADRSWLEPSFGILGVSVESTMAIARRFGQAAFFICDRTGVRVVSAAGVCVSMHEPIQRWLPIEQSALATVDCTLTHD